MKYNIIKDVSELITTNRCIIDYMLSIYPDILKRQDYKTLVNLAEEKKKFIETKNNYYPYNQLNYITNEKILKSLYKYSSLS